MFSKTIFKQTLKQNWKLWAIFTSLTAIMGAVIMFVFDPRRVQRMSDMFANVGIAGGEGGGIVEMLESFTLLGMMGGTFYGLQGIILPLIFVIMTANSLIASSVDRGSMAYTLSTPIKRIKVVSTQALYLIFSLIAMFTVVTLVGLAAVQIQHNVLWGEAHTPDVVAASEVLSLSRDEVAIDLRLIIDNPEAVAAGAEARRIDEDVYIEYLELKIYDNAMRAAADVLEVSVDQVLDDLALIRYSDAALQAAADEMSIPSEALAATLDEALVEPDEATTAQNEAMQDSMRDGIYAAAEHLGIESGDLAMNMGRMRHNTGAMNAAVEASGLPEQMFITVINQQSASHELDLDQPIEFGVMDYINLNVGMLLLLFAIGGIAFLFSCVFNLTKNSLALGAGIPIGFLILEIMSQSSEDLEFLRYFSLNTMFDPSAITGGGTFIPQFVAMAVIGMVLYMLGIKIFKEKDLPL